MTIVKLYICMNSYPQNKIAPHPKKKIKFIKKEMPMPELHTAPALSRLFFCTPSIAPMGLM